MRKFHNDVKRRLILKVVKQYKVENLLSLGCGKGGDISKWVLA